MGEMSAQADEMVGVPPVWAVLAAEEQGTPITTGAQALRRQHLAVAEEKERRRLEEEAANIWRERARARQTAASPLRRRKHTPRPVDMTREGIHIYQERDVQAYASQRVQT